MNKRTSMNELACFRQNMVQEGQRISRRNNLKASAEDHESEEKKGMTGKGLRGDDCGGRYSSRG